MIEPDRPDPARDFETAHGDHNVSANHRPDSDAVVMTCHDCGAVLDLPLAELVTQR
ncbi:MAG: hypothetical protein WA208_20745 [Thermoanaerobaculia bacterium]